MKKITFLTLAVLLLNFKGKAQKWVDLMTDSTANFYDIVKEFDAYWKDRPYERGHGFKAFKRWQWFCEPRVYPSGDMKFAARGYAFEQYQKFMAEAASQHGSQPVSQIQSTTASWVPMGPFGSPTNGDAGRIQTIKMSPAGTNTFYVGTAAGGFWITTNNGVSYVTTTDNFGSCGISDIAIPQQSPSIIYVATGDKDAGDTKSTGVLKSTDGGNTWAQTGLLWTTSQQRRIYRLLANPQNANSLIAATSVGMYKSWDAGATWSLCAVGNYQDAEYKPGDTTVVHVVTASGYARSTNGGLSYTAIVVASPLTVNRLSLAVTPANPLCLYILCSAPNNGFGGLYRSTDGGSTFNLRSNSPNIFDWSTNGSGAGGQGWYDIAIDASPTSSNEIVIGGVNTWKSINGGTGWTLNTHWTGGGGKPYVHADCHHVLYVNATTVFLGTDGGVARTTNSGTNYTTINANMNIAQIYKMGLSAATPSRLVTGHQDNGTNLLSTGTTWAQIYGGDGMDCNISWANDNTIIQSYVNGDYHRSTNGGGAWTSIVTGLTGSAAWVAPIVQSPSNANTYYCGYSQVFKTTNQGTNWTQIGTVSTGQIDEVKISPSNTNVIYVTSSGSIYKTLNDGVSWQNVTGVVSQSASITDLAICNTNSNKIWATLSGYSNGQKVYSSMDGGVTWTNYSAGLPNIPVNCILYKNNSPDVLYAGTDVGVYYREASMNAWVLYNTGMPNIVIDDMELSYTGKLRAATYARGVWETNQWSIPGAVPVAYFGTGYNPGCVTIPLQFNDLSSNNPTSWSWTFNGGAPATSTLQNPTVTYATAGIYTVTLIATNGNGASTLYTSTVNISNPPTVTSIPKTICLGDMANLQVSTNANQVIWQTGYIGNFLTVSNTVTTIFSYTAYLGACSTVSTNTVFVDTPPITPVVIVNMGSYLTTTTAAMSYQWYVDGNIIAGATANSCTPAIPGTYIVEAVNGACTVISTGYVINTVAIKEIKMWQEFKTSPNPAKDALFLNFGENLPEEATYTIHNNLGQEVESGSIKPDATNKAKLNIQQLTAGVYYLELKTPNNKNTSKFVKQ